MLLKKVKIIIIIFVLLFSTGLALAGDETQITELCKNGGVIQLEARTYIISNSFSIPSDTDLRGSNGTVLMLADNCGIPQNIPMIDLTGKKNIKITNIRFEGNQDEQTYALAPNPNHPGTTKRYGNQFNTFIYAVNSQNLTVTYCAFNDNLGDGLRLSGCTNVEFAYNTGSMGGHDTFFGLRSEGLRVHHNNINPLVNSAFRLLDCSHVRVYNNILEWNGPRDAGPAIQIQHDTGIMKDIEVCNNVILNSFGPGLWLVGKTSGNEELWLHHNLFMNSGKNHGISWVGGIIASGYDSAKIDHNVFDGSYLGAVNFIAVSSSWATKATTTLDSNILTNAIPGTNSGKGGYGVLNEIGAQTVTSSQNCYYNNVAGNTNGCSVSSSDIFNDPKRTATPSGWTWNGQTWVCAEVNPSGMGTIPVDANGYNVYRDLKPITNEEIEEFDNIFDILKIKMPDTGITNQTADDIHYTITKTDSGMMAGGIKIIGFKDVVKIDNISYIPDDKSVLVKYEAVKSPSLNFFGTGIEKMDKKVNVEIKNGTANATLSVTTKYYTVSTNHITKNPKKNFKTTTATFTDSLLAPNVLIRPTEKAGIINEYRNDMNPNTRVFVPNTGLVKIDYQYGENISTHTFMIGERKTDEKGVQYTTYTNVDRWDGNIPNMGNELIIAGKFDKNKLNVTCFTPYESFKVTNFKYTVHEIEKETWVKPLIGFIIRLLLLLFCGYKLMRIIFP